MAVSNEQAGSDGKAKIRRGEDWTQLHLHHARPALPPYLGPLRFPWLAFLEQDRETPLKVWGHDYDGAYRQLPLCDSREATVALRSQ